MGQSLRIAFMGTPDFVMPTVQALADSHHDLVCIYTQPPREKGRHKKIEKTPVHIMAEELGVEVRYPSDFKTEEDIQNFQNLNLDVAIVAAYGMLLPEPILQAPRHGCINIHPSLLPRWRGPSPIQYALWKGDTETGVSVMSLEKGMDTGPLLAQEKQTLNNEITFSELNDVLWQKGTSALMKVLDELSDTQTLKSTPQSEEGVTYCKLLTKEQGRINFSQTAQEINCQVRALNPWPGTWCLDSQGRRLKILEVRLSDEKTSETPGVILSEGRVSCGEGSILILDKIQPENKKPMDCKAALNGGYLQVEGVLQ